MNDSLKGQVHIPGIFSGTFLQPVNSTKNSILNWVMKLSLFMCFFSFLFCKYPWKLFGLDTYKQA